MKQAVRTGIYSWIRMVLAMYCLALAGLYPHAMAVDAELDTPAPRTTTFFRRSDNFVQP